MATLFNQVNKLREPLGQEIINSESNLNYCQSLCSREVWN